MTFRNIGPVFIDAFAGCGGLSLGLMQAGLHGLFAIEEDEFAFSTLKRNLIDRDIGGIFSWPDWLPIEKFEIERLIKDYTKELSLLRGKIDILAGGPPCQGFSSAGRRRADDPPNSLFRSHIDLVDLVAAGRVVFLE